MSTHAVNNLSSSYLQSLVTSALKSASAPSSAATPRSDSSTLSPFAQLLSTLQQLQESDPAKYKQVTEQIATNLAAASQTATSQGNTGAATQLNQLVTDFTNASATGQLPNIQDLAQATSQDAGGQAVGGHHGHHHHSDGASSEASSTASTSATQTLIQQLLAAYQSNGTAQSDALNPLSIINDTLQSANLG